MQTLPATLLSCALHMLLKTFSFASMRGLNRHHGHRHGKGNSYRVDTAPTALLIANSHTASAAQGAIRLRGTERTSETCSCMEAAVLASAFGEGRVRLDITIRKRMNCGLVQAGGHR